MLATTENQNYFSSPPPPPPAPSKQPLPAFLQRQVQQLVGEGGGGPLSQGVNYCIDQTRPPPALFLGVDHLPEFQPSQVESGMDDRDDTVSEERQGKFLQYWLTTTFSATVTYFSKTYTIASVICTPPGANEC